MKNKEQILEHLLEVGYTDKAIVQICAYLIGAGVKKRAEVLKIRKGDADFDDFLVWNKGLIFKKGDCITFHWKITYYCIEDCFDDCFVKICSNRGLPSLFRIKDNTRLATPEERTQCDVELARNGLYFDKETLTVKPLH